MNASEYWKIIRRLEGIRRESKKISEDLERLNDTLNQLTKEEALNQLDGLVCRTRKLEFHFRQEFPDGDGEQSG